MFLQASELHCMDTLLKSSFSIAVLLSLKHA